MSSISSSVTCSIETRSKKERSRPLRYPTKSSSASESGFFRSARSAAFIKAKVYHACPKKQDSGDDVVRAKRICPLVHSSGRCIVFWRQLFQPRPPQPCATDDRRRVSAAASLSLAAWYAAG